MLNNFTFWMHGDIVNMQSRLKAALDGTNQTVVACGGGLPVATASSWASFYQAGVAWCSQAANWINTGSQATQGQAIEQELVAWQEKIAGSCSLTVPIYTPTPANTTASEVVGAGIIGAAGLTSMWAFNKTATYLLAKKGKPAAKRLRRKSRRRVVRRHAHA